MPLRLSKIQALMIEDIRNGNRKIYTPLEYAKRVEEREKLAPLQAGGSC